VKQINVCIADLQVPATEAVSVPASPFIVVSSDEQKLVRSPGPAHPYVVVPPEVQESVSMLTTSDSGSQTAFAFPSVAVYCHPPSPSASSPPYYRSAASPMQYVGPPADGPSPAGSRPRITVSDLDEAVTPAAAKPAVCAQLSVPLDGGLQRRRRRRSPSPSLSRCQSHPLQRHRRQPPRPAIIADVDALSSRQTGQADDC